jgi:hypothetical protein
MPTFAVIAPGLDPRLEEAIKANFGEADYYKINPQQFIVYSRNLTTQGVSDALGAAGGNVGRVMVLFVTNFAGWHARDLWEWITRHQNSTPPSEESAASDG